MTLTIVFFYIKNWLQYLKAHIYNNNSADIFLYFLINLLYKKKEKKSDIFMFFVFA